MPPKQQPSKKAEQKRKEKVIEDKTFGMKNKKGNQNQKYVQQVQNQMRNNNTRVDQQKAAADKAKKAKDELMDLNNFLNPVAQKISKDVDPKSMLCLFFKQGMCTKGNKCKFSHDLAVEQKTAKRNLYVDSRELKEEEKEDNMDGWDEEKLKEVVDKKHSSDNRNQTSIVCKYFIQAVEDAKYGWFWECPNNGDKCQYRHCLPEGYILKKDRKKMEDQKKENEISLEELIEKERAALSSKNLTKITLQSFVAWKKKKLREKKEKEEAELKAKMAKIKQGKALGMSGRDLFMFNADLIADDDEAGDMDFERDEENVNPDERIMEINDEFFKFEGMDYDEAEPSTAAATEGVSNMAINEDLFDVDDVDNLDSGSEDEGAS